jgi:hypothetical protein
MKRSILDYAFQHFPVEMVIAHAAEAKEFVLQKLRDDRQIHDLMWFLLEDGYSDSELARLLQITQADLAEQKKKLVVHAVSFFAEYGVVFDLDNIAATEASMRRNLPFFGRGLAHP